MAARLWVESPQVTDIKSYYSNDFASEKEMCEYINNFAPLFAKDVLEISYQSHQKEYYLGSKRLFRSVSSPRADFLFVSKTGENILIECKNPKSNYAELINSIGQVLSYFCIAKANGIKISRCCIIANKFDERIRQVINEFSLPIEFYILTKHCMLKLAN